MLYQLSYASPNNRVSRPKNKTLEPVSQQVHNCQGYHRPERLRNLPMVHWRPFTRARRSRQPEDRMLSFLDR
jgi:hypothetical protein